MIVESTFAARLRTSTAVCALLSMLMLVSAPVQAEDTEATLPDVVVREAPTMAEKYKLPNTTASVTAEKLADTVNVMDVQDAVKYMPSLSVRKRNNGDTQSILGTRTWGYNSSARTLVYADDILLSALIANDNSRGGPRWGMVAPEEIERVDMMYGPFAAQHPGNSMGGVLQITTRMPDKFEATVKQTESLQDFSLYKTKDTYTTSQTAVTLGNRIGDFSFFVSGNTANSFSQPLTVITNGATANPAGTTGTITALNKTGAPANVVGVGGLLHTEMDNIKGKFVYDLTPELKASYTLGFWQNHGRSRVESYLKDSAGNSTYGSVSGFASSNYILEQMQTSHALSLKSDTKGMWDFEGVATHVQYEHDSQRGPSSVTGSTFSNAGTFIKMDGTNWTTVDGKAIWRPEGKAGEHEVSFGSHFDRYVLVNTTYTTANWRTEGAVNGTSTDGRGNTQTSAIWAQDAWNFAPGLKATIGGRYEYWNTFDGFNLASNGVAKVHPSRDSTAISPKGSLAWEFVPSWAVTGSVGRATRFATVSELYQVTGSGVNQVIPNPVLLPERLTSYELSLETSSMDEGKARVSFFLESVRNAIISQTSFLNGVSTSSTQNIDEIRNRGIEFAAEKRNLAFMGFDLSGSLTYVDAEIVRDPTWSGGTQVEGKRVPNVPDMKATLVATYRPTDEWALTTAARYQGKISSTLDNTDYVHGVYGSFDRFFVVDVRARYKHNENLEGAIGIDNVNNATYWEFHPFPQRTFVAEVKMKL